MRIPSVALVIASLYFVAWGSFTLTRSVKPELELSMTLPYIVFTYRTVITIIALSSVLLILIAREELVRILSKLFNEFTITRIALAMLMMGLLVMMLNFGLVYMLSIILPREIVTEDDMGGFQRDSTGFPAKEEQVPNGEGPSIGVEALPIADVGNSLFQLAILLLGLVLLGIVVAAYRRSISERRVARRWLEMPDIGEGEVKIGNIPLWAKEPDRLYQDIFKGAVVRCYRAMCMMVSKLGIRPKPSQTASEYRDQIVGSLGAVAGPVGKLTELFEESRYSDHGIGEGKVVEALENLRAMRRILKDRLVQAYKEDLSKH